VTGARPGFVGRATETARLVELIAAVERGADRPVPAAVLVGEPGIGKTKLADEVAARTAARGWHVVRAEAEAGDQTPFAALVGLRRELGIDARVDPSLPGSEQRWEVLLQLVEAVASRGPTLVVIDDIQWLDDASRWVVDRLARHLAGQVAVVLATSRPPESDGPDPLGRLRRDAEVIELAGLDLASLAELAAGLGGRDADVDVDIDALAARTGGNPLFARELLVAGDGPRLPRAIEVVLRASLDRLAARTRDAVALAALAGPDTPAAVLAEAWDRPLSDVLSALDDARRHEVLDPRTTDGLRFRHVLLADAARTLTPPPVACEQHLALARAWEGRGGPDAVRRAIGHRLRALPLGDPIEVVSAAAAVSRDAARDGDTVGAVAYGAQALGALAAHAPDAVELRATLLVEHADLLDALGDPGGAIGAFAAAASLVPRSADPALRARAEIGAARQMNMHRADPGRQARLGQLERELPAGDRADRVALLGRVALLQAAATGDITEAHATADRAVSMARRIGGAALLIDALCDRHQVVVDLDGFDRRARAADEIVELARRAGDPTLGLRGHEWHFTSQLERGDGDGAARALDQAEDAALLLPSPRWRYTAAIRRVSLMTLAGDRDGALALIDQARVGGASAVDELQLVSLEAGLRVAIQRLWGLPDDDLAPVVDRLDAGLDELPVPFFRVRWAMAQLALGRMDAARRMVERHVPQVDALARAVEGSGTIAILGALVADLGLTSAADPMARALRPFAGLLGSGNGIGVDVPIHATLGRLALLAGDPHRAVDHLRSAVAFARGFPSPVLEARVRWWLADALAAVADDEHDPASVAERTTARDRAADLGVVLGPRSQQERPPVAAAHGGPRPAQLTLGSDGWSVTSPFGTAVVAGSRGMDQLAALLAAPDHQLTAVHLAGGVADVPVAAGLGPALDARAKHAYRRRIRELQAEIDEADVRNDPARSARAHVELDALMAELRRAVGLGGRDRPIGSGAERARINVTRSLKRAIAMVGAALPELGEHLATSVQTGSVCAYRPDPDRALAWTVER
jgi:hypothetical protein